MVVEKEEAIPLRWRLAGMLRRLPEFRGRDRLTIMVLGGTPPPDGIHRGVFGPGLRFEARFRDDGSFVDLYFLQFEPPSLVPVLEEALDEGGVFFDVGANIGIYAAWAAKLVGPSGVVHAYEPVPATRAELERFLSLNDLRNVRIVSAALGAAEGSLTLYVVPGASGLSSAVARPQESRVGGNAVPSVDVRVSMSTLDAQTSGPGAPKPDLVKIDVEGYEFDVIRGARALLRGDKKPAILFESREEHLPAGTGFREIATWLEREAGYVLFALLPEGLKALTIDGGGLLSSNTIALHPVEHARLRERLSRRRFRRNQTC
jgi:FkbM family methyltransferase